MLLMFPAWQVLENTEGGTEGSLMSALDMCATVMGKRRLRAWLCRAHGAHCRHCGAPGRGCGPHGPGCPSCPGRSGRVVWWEDISCNELVFCLDDSCDCCGARIFVVPASFPLNTGNGTDDPRACCAPLVRA